MHATVAIDDYVLDTLLRDLVGHDHRPAAFITYLWLAGEQARQKRSVSISYIELAQNTGLSRSSVQTAVTWLRRRKLITASKQNATAVPVYTVQSPWRKHAS